MKVEINLAASDVVSESAKLPNHIVRRVKGKAPQVFFRKSEKEGLTAAFKAGRTAYKAAEKLHKANKKLDTNVAAQKTKPSDVRKAKIASLRAEIKTLRKSVTDSISTARKHLRKFGTTVSLPFTKEDLLNERKFNNTPPMQSELKVKGVRGDVKPALIADDKWAETVGKKAAAKPAAKTAAKVAPVKKGQKPVVKLPTKLDKKPAKKKKAQTIDEIEDEMAREAYIRAGKKIPKRLQEGAAKPKGKLVPAFAPKQKVAAKKTAKKK